MKLSHIPPRLAIGAFILNSGITKLGADDDTAKGLHGMASGPFPFVEKMEPRAFAKSLAVGEVVLGGALLAPFIPSWLAGTALAGFSGSLLRLYAKTPGMTKEDGVRPSQQGTPLAKDVWMFGTAAGMVIDDLTHGRATRRAAIESKRAAKARAQARDAHRAARKAKRSAKVHEVGSLAALVKH